MLYLTLNSATCLIFVDRPLYHCASRVDVNYGISVSLAIASWGPTLLVFEPVKLEQLTWLKPLMAHQWVGALSGSALFLCTVALLAANERFAPSTPAILVCRSFVSVGVFVTAVALGVGVVRRAGRLAASTKRPTENDRASVVVGTQWGAMWTWRIVMHSASVALVAVTVTLPIQWSELMVPLSFACMAFHFFLSAECESVIWPVVHWLTHSSYVYVIGYMAYLQANHGLLAQCAIQALFVYPVVVRSLLRLRHFAKYNNAAIDFVASSFRILWGSIIPSTLYFCIDSAGCLLGRPMDYEWQFEHCSAR